MKTTTAMAKMKMKMTERIGLFFPGEEFKNVGSPSIWARNDAIPYQRQNICSLSRVYNNEWAATERRGEAGDSSCILLILLRGKGSATELHGGP